MKDKTRLKAAYLAMPEDQLIRMALHDPAEYEEGIFDLVMDAVRARRLSAKLKASKARPASKPVETKWVAVYHPLNRSELALVEMLLDREGIHHHVDNKNFSSTSLFGIGAFAVRVMTPLDQSARAREVLNAHMKKG